MERDIEPCVYILTNCTRGSLFPVIASELMLRARREASDAWQSDRLLKSSTRKMERGIEPCVYILTNWKHTVLYTGVTNNLYRRMQEHREKKGNKFSSRYNLNKLVFVETAERMEEAIAFEKQIKTGSRKKKIELINTTNPDWNDLYDEYF